MKGYSLRSLFSSDTKNIDQASRYLGSLGDPPEGSRDKEELQAHAKMIRVQKYLETKAATTALNVL